MTRFFLGSGESIDLRIHLKKPKKLKYLDIQDPSMGIVQLALLFGKDIK
jgi:hypothetical protein